MYNVVIADDERIIRDGIAAGVDWQSHGFSLVGRAEDGVEALDLIRKKNPDLVITDIKMPGMDGLELIEKVKGESAGVTFVILSGYGEFDFAKRAMAYGVKHFLLKPTDDDEIAKTLVEVYEELEEKAGRKRQMSSLERKVKKTMPLVKEQFLRDCIMDRTYTKAEREYYMDLVGIANERCRLILFQPHDELAFDKLLALKSISEEVIEKRLIYLNTCIRGRLLSMVRNIDDRIVTGLISEIKNRYDRLIGGQITASYSDADTFSNIGRIYAQTDEYLSYAFYLGVGSIISRHNTEEVRDAQEHRHISFDYEPMALAVKSGNQAEATKRLSFFFSELQTRKYDIDETKTHCLQLLMAIIRQDSRSNIDGYIGNIAEFLRYGTLKQIRKFVEDTANEIAAGNHARIARKHSRIIDRLIQFVSDHVNNEDMSLKWIANHVIYMNAEHLGRLFKRETDQKFSQYVMKLRIEKAKELIERDSDMRINEIADRVGFGLNSQYFSHIFKQYAGLSPSEYRSLQAPSTASRG